MICKVTIACYTTGTDSLPPDNNLILPIRKRLCKLVLAESIVHLEKQMILKKQISPIDKELQLVEKQEQKLENAALRARSAGWKQELERKIPKKVYDGLESAFCKGLKGP